MKPRHRFSLIVLLAATLGIPHAQSCISEHGTEPLGCSRWSAALTEIVNDKARVSGQIGPLAPTSYFHYNGDLEAFQRVLAKYAALQQPDRILYLKTGFGRESDFDLSITMDGHGFLLFNAGGHIPLEQLKIPAGVSVEFLPDAGEPIDPQEKAKLVALQKRLTDFAAAHRAAAPPASGKPGR